MEGASGIRAGSGGYSYLYEPLWWVGMITMVVGEVANFPAYAFAPTILVTPLGALTIIISAVLAYIILKERLHIFGVVDCALCVVGSTTIVLHAPEECAIESVREVTIIFTCIFSQFIYFYFAVMESMRMSSCLIYLMSKVNMEIYISK
ncbi:hypothetical protein L1887_13870 [Cichorium endivia]|nr:hypothetical protein L1887_13870 [Cichorium endivia]